MRFEIYFNFHRRLKNLRILQCVYSKNIHTDVIHSYKKWIPTKSYLI